MLLTVFGLLTALLVIATLLPIWRCEHWVVRSFDFPRLQFSLALLILLALELLLLDWQAVPVQALLAVGAACLVYQSSWIFRYSPLMPKEVQSVASAGRDSCIRLLAANVLTPNRNAKALLDLVHAHQPDILVTLESDAWWQEQLDSLSSSYPYSVKCPLDNLYGIHVYSQLKLSDASIEYLVEDDIPSVHALVHMRSGRTVRCHFLHPAPPSPTQNEASIQRDAELVLVAKGVAEHDEPTIVAGDLNDVAWSETTRLFRKISGLLDPRIGRGMFNTFHAKYWFLRWPLDHLFHSDHFGLARLERLGNIGSDHFPLLTELVYLGDDGDDQQGIEPDQDDRELAREKVESVGVGAKDAPDPGH
jgi:endonuclease/exonuclease/phosphatase (EEP) superfamily protein YafD